MFRTLVAAAVFASGFATTPLLAQENTESRETAMRDSISWESDLSDALAIAKDEGKRIMLILGNAK